METGKILSKRNIPDSVKVGFSNMTVLECANKNVYLKMEHDLRGSIFHLQKDGRYFIAIQNSIAKLFEKITEQ